MFAGIIACVVAVFFVVFVIRILGMPVYALQAFRDGRPWLGWSMAIVSLAILWVVWDVASSLMHMH
jgi:hypothetical protein